jgi:Holliday junction resolvase
MANPSKARGTAWESAVVSYLRDHGLPVRRNAQHGARDIGDIGGLDRWAIEAKDCAAIDLAGFVDQANVEARNAGASWGVAVVKRRRRSVEEAYVVQDLRSWTETVLFIESLAEAAREVEETAVRRADLFDVFPEEGRPFVYLDEVEDLLRTALEGAR